MYRTFLWSVKREFSTCGEYVRKASDACVNRIAFKLRSVQHDDSPRNEARYESDGRMIPFERQYGVCCNSSRVH